MGVAAHDPVQHRWSETQCVRVRFGQGLSLFRYWRSQGSVLPMPSETPQRHRVALGNLDPRPTAAVLVSRKFSDRIQTNPPAAPVPTGSRSAWCADRPDAKVGKVPAVRHRDCFRAVRLRPPERDGLRMTGGRDYRRLLRLAGRWAGDRNRATAFCPLQEFPPAQPASLGEPRSRLCPAGVLASAGGVLGFGCAAIPPVRSSCRRSHRRWSCSRPALCRSWKPRDADIRVLGVAFFSLPASCEPATMPATTVPIILLNSRRSMAIFLRNCNLSA